MRHRLRLPRRLIRNALKSCRLIAATIFSSHYLHRESRHRTSKAVEVARHLAHRSLIADLPSAVFAHAVIQSRLMAWTIPMRPLERLLSLFLPRSLPRFKSSKTDL